MQQKSRSGFVTGTLLHNRDNETCFAGWVQVVELVPFMHSCRDGAALMHQTDVCVTDELAVCCCLCEQFGCGQESNSRMTRLSQIEQTPSTNGAENGSIFPSKNNFLNCYCFGTLVKHTQLLFVHGTVPRILFLTRLSLLC